MPEEVVLNIEISRNVARVFAPDVRIRVLYGGRTGQKSYGFCDKALQRMVVKRCDIAVCREKEITIKDSVHKLIKERIVYHNMERLFTITNNSVTYIPNGSTIIYKHLHDNPEVRGLEGSEICWIFEGHDLQKESWDVLNPTIRRTPRMEQDPEIWIEFNPQYEDDFAYTEFIEKTGPDRIAIKTNYTDNPWCPESSIALAEQCRRNAPDEYNHIWLGEPRNTGGLIYPMFDLEEHVRAVDMSRVEHVANFFMGQDPHTVYYPACVWFAKIARGDGSYDYCFYNEWPLRSTFNGELYHALRKEKTCALTLMQRAKLYRILDNTIDKTYHGITDVKRAIDTRFAKGAGTSSTTNNTRGIIIEMADNANGGLTFETPPEYMIDIQRDNVKELLGWDTLIPTNAFNEPRMYVMPHCENIIDTLRFHRFDRKGKEKEDEKRKDFGDAIKIGLALAQQTAYVDRTIKKSVEEYTEPSRVEILEDMYMGSSSTQQKRLTTPSCN